MRRATVVAGAVTALMLSTSPVNPLTAVITVAAGAAVRWAAQPARNRT